MPNHDAMRIRVEWEMQSRDSGVPLAPALLFLAGVSALITGFEAADGERKDLDALPNSVQEDLRAIGVRKFVRPYALNAEMGEKTASGTLFDTLQILPSDVAIRSLRAGSLEVELERILGRIFGSIKKALPQFALVKRGAGFPGAAALESADVDAASSPKAAGLIVLGAETVRDALAQLQASRVYVERIHTAQSATVSY